MTEFEKSLQSIIETTEKEMESKFEDLKGKVLREVTGLEKGSTEIVFKFYDDTVYKMYHDQDCCEGVYVEDVIGNPSDLIGLPLVIADESTNDTDPPAPDSDESYLWTFYKLDTEKGGVTIRWFGSSNGYYSTGVTLYKVG